MVVIASLLQFNPWSRVHRDFRAAERYWAQYQQTTPAQMEADQLAAVQRVWSDAVADVVYYRNLVVAGKAPARIGSWEQFQQIPLLTRELLQAHAGEFRRLSGPPDAVRMTGGSTAQPVRIGVWNAETIPHRVVKLVLWLRAGYRPSDRLFLIWGHLHLLGTGWRRGLNHLVRKVKDGMLGYRRIDAYSLTPEKCDATALELLRFRPAGLIGYASALDYFVRVTNRHHDAFRKAGLKFVMPASELPPKPDTFELLARVFNCPVVQEFAGVEFGQVAMKFGEEPFLTFPDLNYLETLPPEGADSVAEPVVLTSLHARYVPLIRYRQGDAISGVTRLANGHVRAFAKLEGRTHDVVQLANGEMIHSMAILHAIHQESAVLNIQLVIRDQGPALRLAVAGGLDPAVAQRIRHRLGQVSRLLAEAPIEPVADIPTTKAGKRRWIVDERSAAHRDRT
jgi:phenylacetate-coenzyme A ligase PaaK-like adenylate-forming protein